MAAEGVIPHIVLEKEFDRVLMEETGKDPDHYYPACRIPSSKKALAFS